MYMDKYRKFTFDILMIARDNPNYTNRMDAARKHMAVEIADRAVEGHHIIPQLVYAYNYFKERAYL